MAYDNEMHNGAEREGSRGQRKDRRKTQKKKKNELISLFANFVVMTKCVVCC